MASASSSNLDPKFGCTIPKLAAFEETPYPLPVFPFKDFIATNYGWGAFQISEPTAPTLEELYRAYATMVLIRRFEERAAQLYGMGQIAGFCHLYIGQEAVVTGFRPWVNSQDTLLTSYRDHGHMLACDMEPGEIMAELTGRITGCSRGKGGSMHMFSREKNFYGGHGIVGAQVPIGTGLAFAHKYKEDGGVCFTYLGDGASNQGQTFESFNMAKLWDLPVVYVIENNQYAMGTSVPRHAAVTHLFTRGAGQNIPGIQVDGMDYLKVRAAAFAAAEYARAHGPVIVEANTYRYRGHSMSDPAKYRDKAEVEEVRTHHDPIHILIDTVLAAGGSQDQLNILEKDSKAKADLSVTFAQESPEPDASELYTDVLI